MTYKNNIIVGRFGHRPHKCYFVENTHISFHGLRNRPQAFNVMGLDTDLTHRVHGLVIITLVLVKNGVPDYGLG